MQGNPAVHRLVAPVANRFFGKADREDSGVVSTAQRHTYSLDSPRIADCVAMSDFRFADLREGAVTIFLCLSSDRIDTYSRWLRLIVVEALTALTRSRATPPCLTASLLFLLDEFAALGWLEPIAPWHGSDGGLRCPCASSVLRAGSERNVAGRINHPFS